MYVGNFVLKVNFINGINRLNLKEVNPLETGVFVIICNTLIYL